MFGIDSFLKGFFSEQIGEFLRNIFIYTNKISQEVGSELSKTPESFNNQVYNTLKLLSENVVLPIAVLFLSIILVINFCKSFLDDRERQNPVKIVIFFIITSVFAIVLVTHSFEITNMILNLTQTAVNNALGLFQNQNINIAGDIETFINTLEDMSLGQITGVWLTLLLTRIILWFVRILSQIVILGRFIEIFMRISIAPIPFATFFNREFSNTGYNFVRSMGAVSLQAILIMVVIAIYRGMLSNIAVDIGTEEQLSLFLIKILGINLTLIFMLFQTKRIADSVLNVH